jgi:ornithine carbamoyltransferase
MSIAGRRPRIAYVGDGNNVCHSLMHAGVMLGCDVTVITPKGFGPDAGVVAECDALAKVNGGKIEVTTKLAAVEGHHVVYTDVWVSMGQADEEGKRLKVFADYQVDADLMAEASAGLPGAWGPSKFMHCLPARRGVEVTDDVIDSPASIVYDQAENRMHAQNALMAAILAR